MSISKYGLRPATDKDFSFCRSLHHKIYRVYISAIWGWDEEKQNNLFQESFMVNTVTIITCDQKDIGFYELRDDQEQINVGELIIDQDYQGFGIGSSILREIIQLAKTKKKTVRIGVFKMNQRAMKLYRSIGFCAEKETKSHYKMVYKYSKEG